MRIGPNLEIDDSDIEEKFVHASGPGGQNVNKVTTAVELRFNARASRALSDAAFRRLIQLAGRRATREGIIIIRAERFRSQDRNRSDARQRLTELLIRAHQRPKRRVATKPTLASKKRRLEAKTRRGMLKKLRHGKPSSD